MAIRPKPLAVPVDPDSVKLPAAQLISLLCSDMMVDPETTIEIDLDELKALRIWCKNATAKEPTK